MSIRIKRIGLLLIIVLLLGMTAVGVISHRQGVKLVHGAMGREYPVRTPADDGLKFRDLSLQTTDGLRLAAWYIPSRNHAAIIVQHGYKDSREDMLPAAAILARHGFGVLLIEARGHGYSDGDLITFGYRETLDIRAGLDFLLRSRDVDPRRIGALGNSQGAVTTLLATARYPEIKAYVGNSPYADLQDEIATGVRYFAKLPAFPFAPLIRSTAEREAGFRAEDVSPLRNIARIAPRPVLLMQGGRDVVIPTDSGRRLFEAARGPKTLWYDPELGHTKFDTDRPAEYELRVVAFFTRYLLATPASPSPHARSGR